MKITKKLTGTTMEIALDDRLDNVTAPEVEKEIEELGKNPDIKELIWDFTDLEYITSAGLRTLLSAQRTLYGQAAMKVVHANEMVREVFELTGLDELLGDE